MQRTTGAEGGPKAARQVGRGCTPVFALKDCEALGFRRTESRRGREKVSRPVARCRAGARQGAGSAGFRGSGGRNSGRTPGTTRHRQAHVVPLFRAAERPASRDWFIRENMGRRIGLPLAATAATSQSKTRYSIVLPSQSPRRRWRAETNPIKNLLRQAIGPVKLRSITQADSPR